MNEPVNPYCRPIGSGTAIAWWTAPGVTVDDYLFFASLALDGHYEQCNASIFGSKAVLVNLPINQTIYLKMQSIVAGVKSDLVQISYAVQAAQQAISVAVRGVRYSKIPAGAVFTVPGNFGAAAVISNQEEIVL